MPWRWASASRSRWVWANSSRAVWSPRAEKSGIFTCRYDFVFESLKCAVLGHPNGPRGAADGGGGLLGRQADHHAQDEDLALLGRQDLEQFVHPGSRIGLDGHLFRAGVGRPALGNRLGAIRRRS